MNEQLKKELIFKKRVITFTFASAVLFAIMAWSFTFNSYLDALASHKRYIFIMKCENILQERLDKCDSVGNEYEMLKIVTGTVHKLYDYNR